MAREGATAPRDDRKNTPHPPQSRSRVYPHSAMAPLIKIPKSPKTTKIYTSSGTQPGANEQPPFGGCIAASEPVYIWVGGGLPGGVGDGNSSGGGGSRHRANRIMMTSARRSTAPPSPGTCVCVYCCFADGHCLGGGCGAAVQGGSTLPATQLIYYDLVNLKHASRDVMFSGVCGDFQGAPSKRNGRGGRRMEKSPTATSREK